MTITVFLADDHTLVCDGLRLIVESQPDMKIVGTAANGREAIVQVSELCPDVAILDISMPELNGIEAAARIREGCSKTRIIIFSMHDNSKHILCALQAGVLGYLSKNASGFEVIKAIREVYCNRRYLSPRISDKIVEDYLGHQDLIQAQTPLARLSPREREVLQLVAEGKSSAAIAQVLFLSPKTVETYRVRLMQKLNLSNLASLVKFAIQNGLTPLEY